MFFQWDGRSQSLSEPVTVPGIYRIVGKQAGVDRYVRVDGRAKPSLLSIERLGEE